MQNILNKPPLVIGNIKYEIKSGIVFIERLLRMQYGVDDLRNNIKIRREYTEGFSYPVIIFGLDMVSMDKASRDFLAGDGAENTLSRAFVVEKTQGKLQLNFFIETNKQPVPTKIFDAIEPAIEWSRQFKVNAQ